MSKEIVKMLEEISSKKAEIVDQTPFDLFEDNLALQVIEAYYILNLPSALKTDFKCLSEDILITAPLPKNISLIPTPITVHLG